jgi:tetrahydromethanopterin S-methyltransferase subunit F
MRLLSRKSESERLLESISDSLDALNGTLTKARLLKAGLVAGGVAGLAAGSAGISALRRRVEGAADNS